MAESPKTKTSMKLSEEISYLGEWSEHMLTEMQQYRDNLQFYTTKKTDHGLTPSKLAAVTAVATSLQQTENIFQAVVKELRKLRGRNVRREK